MRRSVVASGVASICQIQHRRSPLYGGLEQAQRGRALQEALLDAFEPKDSGDQRATPAAQGSARMDGAGDGWRVDRLKTPLGWKKCWGLNLQGRVGRGPLLGLATGRGAAGGRGAAAEEQGPGQKDPDGKEGRPQVEGRANPDTPRPPGSQRPRPRAEGGIQLRTKRELPFHI